MDLQIIPAHAVIICVDEKELTDEEKDRDGEDTDEIFRNASAFDDQMPCDREEQDLNERVKVLSDQHFDKLNTDNNIKKIDEIGTESKEMDLIKFGRQISYINDRSDDDENRYSDFQDECKTIDPLFNKMNDVKHFRSPFLQSEDVVRKPYYASFFRFSTNTAPTRSASPTASAIHGDLISPAIRYPIPQITATSVA